MPVMSPPQKLILLAVMIAFGFGALYAIRALNNGYFPFSAIPTALLAGLVPKYVWRAMSTPRSN